MSSTPQHARELLDAGYTLLYRFDPRRKLEGKNPFQLDSSKPSFDLKPVLEGESRFSALPFLYPQEAEVKHVQLLHDLQTRYNYYATMAGKKE
jgi:pyruvate-ferredoxin/flavodoxin oxidoreductase